MLLLQISEYHGTRLKVLTFYANLTHKAAGPGYEEVTLKLNKYMFSTNTLLYSMVFNTYILYRVYKLFRLTFF